MDEYNKYADSFNGEIDFSIAQKPTSYTDGDGRSNFSDEVETVTDRIHETLKERYYYAAKANKSWWSSQEEIFNSPYTHTGIENYLTYFDCTHILR